MKMSKIESDKLAVLKLVMDIENDFNVSHVNVFVPDAEEVGSGKFSKIKNHFPIEVWVVDKFNRVLKYHWDSSASDDEYALESKDGNSFGFWEMKDYIQKKLPQAFSGKAFYSREEGGYRLSSSHESLFYELLKKDEIIKLNEAIDKDLSNKKGKSKASRYKL